jgi:Putative lumazine-binding
MRNCRQGCVGMVLLALVLAFSSPVWAASSEQKTLTPEERAVLAPLEKVFDGIAKHDRSLAKEQLLPGGMVTLKRSDRIVQMSFDQFVEHIPATGTEKLEERIHDPLIRIDDDIAIIWAPYVFSIDGKGDHEGTDIVNLVKKDGRWLISGIADNGRKVQGGR